MGALLRRLRQETGLTQRELAQTLHVSAQAVSKWETGAGCPDVKLLAVLAEREDLLTRPAPVITAMGSDSLLIYLLHQPVLYLLTPMLERIIGACT